MDIRVPAIEFDANGVSDRTGASEGLGVIVAILFDSRASPDAISAFKTALINCPMVLRCTEVIGSFDFIIEAVFPDMGAYNNQLKRMAERLVALVARHETSFVGRHFIRAQYPDRAIWVPSDKGLRRVDFSIIDKVVAEGDYMTVHSDGTSWMLHSTLHALVERLPADGFVQINRSTLVRYGFISNIARSGRKWLALLGDGTQELITKGRTAEILRALRGAPSKPQHNSTN
jgi:hypothetical protein